MCFFVDNLISSTPKDVRYDASSSQWVINFLTSRKQRVKLSSSCYSNWELMPAGVPQGTKLGPWLFLLMINDLRIPGVPTWKYVDDTTIA